MAKERLAGSKTRIDDLGHAPVAVDDAAHVHHLGDAADLGPG
jgi:hypothetical protein